MLIGAHVSTSGGLPKAVERGVETESTAIQIFNQSPRMWRPTKYTDDDFAAFRAAMADSPVDAVVIHAIYLINPGSFDPEISAKGLGALTHALQVGDAIGAAGVVLHPGPVMKGQEYEPTVKNIVAMCAAALAESSECKLLLENAAGANAVGGKFEHLADLIEQLDAPRVGVCIDSCHSHAAGYDVRSLEAVTETFDELDRLVGLDKVGALHLNDSRDEFGSHRDRHDNLGEGFIGADGVAAFLSDPRLQDVPALLEVPGQEKDGPSAADVRLAFELREKGLKARAKK
ncbi:MAG: deoxyribonuclease IV [Thermoleophilaceae bacterium]|nr:deoxyribonuclease IV [Thermoleophilaceae bacterium]